MAGTAKGDKEIKTGVRLIEYMQSMSEIILETEAALTYATECRTILESGEAYQGEAHEEMKQYFDSLDAHLQRLVSLYRTAETYLANAFKMQYAGEEQILRIIELLGEG